MSGPADRPRKSLTYRDAGVDIDAQDDALRRIRESVRSTRTAGVLSELGSFGGLFRPELSGLREPVLVSSADGIGTKLRVAFRAGVHDTVGRDLVHHCVNDILVQGARPLFFMDYVATGRLEPAVLAAVVEGIARGCRGTGCALLGGETAEMPGFYADGEYDVAGFIVGLVDREALLDGAAVRPGDVVLGMPSAGLHTNGYSLARKIFFDVAGLDVGDRVEELGGTVGEVLLAEHRCYLDAIGPLLGSGTIRALAHITGGGLTDNLPRVLPPGLSVEIRRDAWDVPAVFRFLQREGNVAESEMFRTFNMGVGLAVIVGEADAERTEAVLAGAGAGPVRRGAAVPGDGKVRYV